MTSEQQETWTRERARRHLVPNAEGFATAGLMSRLNEPLLHVYVLPSNPLEPVLTFEDEALAGLVLPQRFEGHTANGVSMLPDVTTTSGALLRFASGTEKWRAYAAVRRDGGVEVGIGSTACYESPRFDPPLRVYRLHVLIQAARVAVTTQARLLQRLLDNSIDIEQFPPYELGVAIPSAGGSVLGALAPGWDEPEHAFGDEVPSCREDDVLARMTQATWPVTDEDVEALVRDIGQRICNAFGRTHPAHIARRGDSAGTIPKDYG